MAIKIVTDSSCDLGINFIEENNIELIPLLLNLDGETLKDDLGKSLGYREFYEKLRAGSMPSTSQINIYTFEEKFKELLDKGYEILYIGLSSALSGTFNSANMARNNILEENPNAKISVVDSLSVSMGVGMLVKKSCDMIEEGKDLEYITTWIEENKNKVIHSILVDDLSDIDEIKSALSIYTTKTLLGYFKVLKVYCILYCNKVSIRLFSCFADFFYCCESAFAPFCCFADFF